MKINQYLCLQPDEGHMGLCFSKGCTYSKPFWLHCTLNPGDQFVPYELMIVSVPLQEGNLVQNMTVAPVVGHLSVLARQVMSDKLPRLTQSSTPSV